MSEQKKADLPWEWEEVGQFPLCGAWGGPRMEYC